MSQTKQQIQALLAAAGTVPRHRYGQNFMIDQNLVRLIAETADLSPADSIIEVGPGTGTLTEELLAVAGRVLAVEIDRDLSASLGERFADRDNFRLIEGDALASKHALHPELLVFIAACRSEHHDGKIKLVANLPYNIASPLVVELLIAGVDELIFTVQKEVADRMNGRAGTENYGPLTVMVSLLAKVQVLRTLGPGIFWPAPGIDSALVRMTADNRLHETARPFSRFISTLFSFRRKTLRRALQQMSVDLPPSVLEAAGFDPNGRAEVLSPERLFELFKAHDWEGR